MQQIYRVAKNTATTKLGTSTTSLTRRSTATLLDRIGLLVETALLQIVDHRQKGIARRERGIFGLLNRLVHHTMILELNVLSYRTRKRGCDLTPP